MLFLILIGQIFIGIRIWHTFIDFTGNIKLVHEIDLICIQLAHKKPLVTKQEPLQVSVYAFKPLCRTTFKAPWGKHQNLIKMMLATDVTLLFLSAVNNDILVYFLCYWCELCNQLNQQIFVILVIRCSYNQSKYQRTLHGKQRFLANVYLVNGMQSENKWNYLTNLVFSEGRTDSCYSFPTLQNPWTYVKQGWCYEVLKSIIPWYRNVLTLSYSMQYVVETAEWVTNWAMWTQYNPGAPLGIIAMISKGCYGQIYNIIKNFNLALSFILFYQQRMLLWIRIWQTFIKVSGKLNSCMK